MNLNFNTRTTTTHTVAHVPRNSNKNRKGSMESRRQLSAWFLAATAVSACFSSCCSCCCIKMQQLCCSEMPHCPFPPTLCKIRTTTRFLRSLSVNLPFRSLALFHLFSLSLSESTWTLICGVCRNRHNKINAKVYTVTSLCQNDVLLTFVRLLALCARVCVGLRWAHFYFRLIKNCRCQIRKLLVCAKYFHLMFSCK